ncbi:MAG TPA: alkaline phosphatase family protein, partial [Acidobacteriaceae bacterium]
MSTQNRVPRSIAFRCSAAILAALQVFAITPAPVLAQPPGQSDDKDNGASTKTPIKHVIVIIGENRTFDHIFATYQPVHGETIDNLLSKGIVNANGTPGPKFALAAQNSAQDTAADLYQVSPTGKSPYPTLPAPLAGGPKTPFISSLAVAEAVENGLPNTQYYTYLTTGGTGLASGAPDTRVPNVNNLPNGPFQLTPGVPYDAYAA